MRSRCFSVAAWGLQHDAAEEMARRGASAQPNLVMASILKKKIRLRDAHVVDCDAES